MGYRYGGRQKGTPNKSTKDVRRAIAAIAERNVHKFEEWLERTAAKDPAKAGDLFLRAIEYHIPKLSRAEVTGMDGKPLEVTVVRYSAAQSLEPPALPAPAVDGSGAGLQEGGSLLAPPLRQG